MLIGCVGCWLLAVALLLLAEVCAEHNLQLSRSIDDFSFFLTIVFTTYPSDMGVVVAYVVKVKPIFTTKIRATVLN